MPIPDFQSLMLPLLKLAADGEEHTSRESVQKLAKEFNLTDQELLELLPSGKQTRFNNRVAWARAHLKMAGLLETPRRSFFKISDRGRSVLVENPSTINMAFLKQFPGYLDSFSSKNQIGGIESGDAIQNSLLETVTPEESIEKGYSEIRKALASELLEQILNVSPPRFERLVIDLLVKMGYGGGFKDASVHAGKAGDEGIDGTIREDKLGLDMIYIQAKKWRIGNNVGRPDIQKFVGALAGHGAKKGVFITTSSFTKEAREYSPRNETKIVLIDGEELAQLMIDYNLGVSIVNNYEIKRIDSDYFVED